MEFLHFQLSTSGSTILLKLYLDTFDQLIGVETSYFFGVSYVQISCILSKLWALKCDLVKSHSDLLTLSLIKCFYGVKNWP